ncbi:hypothetical protein ACIA58_19715 [Kribbella sp. NPDC051586]|uniref:hypothetical protein n=1 Tax=Kribbella sp. NPDC051586 TaxID=3364118 RepID=UPI00379B3279
MPDHRRTITSDRGPTQANIAQPSGSYAWTATQSRLDELIAFMALPTAIALAVLVGAFLLYVPV